MPNSVVSLGYIKCYSSSTRPVKNSSNSIRHILSVRRSAVDQEDLKPCWKSEKSNIFQGDQQLFTGFSKTLLPRKKTNRAVVFSSRLFPYILKYRTTNMTFQQSGKQDSFRHILKSSASIYESPGTQLFRTTTGIQSGLD